MYNVFWLSFLVLSFKSHFTIQLIYRSMYFSPFKLILYKTGYLDVKYKNINRNFNYISLTRSSFHLE